MCEIFKIKGYLKKIRKISEIINSSANLPIILGNKEALKIFLIIFLLIFQTFLKSSGQTTVFFENFNNSSSLPSGWSEIQVTGSDVWTINNGGYYDNGSNHPAAAYSGTRNAFLFSPTSPPSSNTRKLVTPALDLGGLTNITLTFYEARLKWGVDKDQLKVYYRTSSTGSWNQLVHYSTETTGWVQRTISLPNPSTTYYIAFEGIAQYGYGICIDDVKITATIGNDAALTNIFVENKNTVKAEIKNSGTNTLTTLDINLSVNQGNTITKSWTGSLSSGNSTTIVITNNYYFSNGTSELKAWTSNPNNTSDGNKSNDTFISKYTLIRNFPYQQGFETADLGNWTQSLTDDMDWTRYSGSTPTSYTGPSSAYEGNYYIYTEASGFSPAKKAELYSVDFDISTITNPYLELWYHMYGTQMGELHIDIDSANVWKNDITVPLSGNKGNQWFKLMVDLNNYKYLNKIRLRGITGTGFLSDLAVDDVKIIDIPAPKLGNDLRACMGDTVLLQADTGYGYQFVWKKLGATDTLSKTNKLSVVSSGVYIVIVSAPYGYSGSDTIEVSFGPLPQAKFNTVKVSSCLKNNLITFTNQSNISSGSMSYLFNLGDNTDTNTVNLQHSYAQAGQFIATLIAVSDYGCKDTFSDTIHVFPDPEAAFSINKTIQCLYDNNFSFNNQCSISSGNLSFKWYFGDNDSSSMQNPSHSYVKSDTFLVRLIAFSDKNCSDTAERNVYIMPHPVADFNINDSTQCLSGNHFIFTNKTFLSYGSLNYKWYFGGKDSSALNNPIYSFNTDGNFMVKLIATSNYGCSDSLTKIVYIFPMPVAKFSISDTSACQNQNNFIFNDLSSIKSGSLTQRLWDFGDQTSSTQTAPVKTYQNDGIYHVVLKVISDNGCADSATKDLTVYPSPQVDFSVNYPEQCLSNNYFYFTNKSGIKTGSFTSIWYLGDGTQKDSMNIHYKYGYDSVFMVKLIITSNKNCKDSLSKQIIVNPMPSARFSINKKSQCINENNYLFTNETTLKSGNYISVWEFGDGENAMTNSPAHQYQSVDTFNVKLKVISGKGCMDSVTKSVYVKPVPQAMFTINDSSQCLRGNQFSFQDQSQIQFGSLQQYWDFGDGEFSDMQNPVKSYQEPGVFKVKLRISSLFGCTDSMIRTVRVHKMPEIFLGNDTLISDTSSLLLDAGEGFKSYLWHDSSTGRFFLIDTSYAPGNYTCFVSITDSNGCSNSDTIRIEIIKINTLAENKIRQIHVYPNPAYEYINIEFPASWHKAIISLINLSGETIYSEEVYPENGHYLIKTDISQMKAGVYLIHIAENEHHEVFKLIKAK